MSISTNSNKLAQHLYVRVQKCNQHKNLISNVKIPILNFKIPFRYKNPHLQSHLLIR